MIIFILLILLLFITAIQYLIIRKYVPKPFIHNNELQYIFYIIKEHKWPGLIVVILTGIQIFLSITLLIKILLRD
ncbi:hypothetical protein BMS3Bbin11_00925 [bacterium BMS3Bbin11]|nr:hypothetical protein BMS3Abin11_01908 [bacterium BMS3Abin11]GBE45832.1 hypothetical protein BMS3Bbin11_00925 [bacterium BMS3Bbin11]